MKSHTGLSLFLLSCERTFRDTQIPIKSFPNSNHQQKMVFYFLVLEFSTSSDSKLKKLTRVYLKSCCKNKKLAKLYSDKQNGWSYAGPTHLFHKQGPRWRVLRPGSHICVSDPETRVPGPTFRVCQFEVVKLFKNQNRPGCSFSKRNLKTSFPSVKLYNRQYTIYK